VGRVTLFMSHVTLFGREVTLFPRRVTLGVTLRVDNGRIDHEVIP
jgi:hypothetical protein